MKLNKGTITNGTLLVEVYVTGAPFRTFTVQKCGYFPLTQNITDYPGKGETVNLYANLTAPEEPLVSDFSGNITSGTAPLLVWFTDHSIGHADTWDWSFGDGTYSEEQNPVHEYIAAGIYNVSLYVTNSACYNDTMLKTGYITVTEAPVQPVADFIADQTTGPAPLLVQFTDTSTGFPGLWNWTFGDGNISTEQDPAYAYETPGLYTVSLTVTNGAGNSTKSVYDFINVTGTPPCSDIGYFLVHSNVDGAAVWFDQTSEGIITNGTLLVEVCITKPHFTSITVEKEGYNPHTQEITQYPEKNQVIDVYANLTPVEVAPVANFTADLTYGDVPLTVQFTDLSTGNPTNWSWDFGDTGTANDQNPVHTYTSEGIYNVTLTASNGAGSGTLDKPDYIWAFMIVGGDKGYYLIHSNVDGAAVYFNNEWPVGEIENGTLLVETCTTCTPVFSFTVQKCGYYPLTQSVTEHPAKDEVVNLYANLTAPEEPLIIDFIGNTTSGTTPLVVGFTESGIGIPDTWNWSFGDGTYSEEQNPVHEYIAAGVYSVSLYVTNTACQNSTEVKPDYITITETPVPPVALFTAHPRSGGPPLPVLFEDLSTGTPVSWYWTFGDGSSSMEQNPAYTYYGQGRYNVSLTVSNEAGNSTLEIGDYIDTSGGPTPPPISDFTSNVTGGFIPLSVQFTDKSIGYVEFREWNFGDGSPLSTEQNPVHTYTAVGKYNVSLYVQNSAGSQVLTQLNYISTSGPISPVPNFTTNTTSGLVPLTVKFIDTSSGFPTMWSWSFGDNSSSSEQNPVHTYVLPGTYTVALSVSNMLGNGSIVKPGLINVHEEPILFTINATSGPNGNISPSGQIPAWEGSSQAFSIIPDANFVIMDVLVDGESKGPVTSYTFTNIQSNHGIEAIFRSTAGTTFNITASAGANGGITPFGIVPVPERY